MDRLPGSWGNAGDMGSARYVCGHCGAEVGPSKGFFKDAPAGHRKAFVYICPTCNRPTYIIDDGTEQTPGPLVGRSIANITDPDVENLYAEARKCLASGAPSAAVMVSRKLLMHMAVQQGAKGNQGFTYYAQYLIDQGIVGKTFVDLVKHIKDEGNSENHELDISTVAEASIVLRLVEFVLASIYEIPGMLPAPPSP